MEPRSRRKAVGKAQLPQTGGTLCCKHLSHPVSTLCRGHNSSASANTHVGSLQLQNATADFSSRPRADPWDHLVTSVTTLWLPPAHRQEQKGFQGVSIHSNSHGKHGLVLKWEAGWIQSGGMKQCSLPSQERGGINCNSPSRHKVSPVIPQ